MPAKLARDIRGLALRRAVNNTNVGNSHRLLDGVSRSSRLAHVRPEGTTTAPPDRNHSPDERW